MGCGEPGVVPNRAELLIRSRVSARNEENGNESQGQGESEPLSPRDVIPAAQAGAFPLAAGWEGLAAAEQSFPGLCAAGAAPAAAELVPSWDTAHQAKT